MLLSDRFGIIDLVVPVPLHPIKERKRGYNQVHSFAKSLSNTLGATLLTGLLEKTSHCDSQTLKVAYRGT